MKKNKFQEIDRKIYQIFEIKDLRTKIFKTITFFGSATFFIIVLLILELIFLNKYIFSLIILMIIQSIVNMLLKRLFKRKRPNIKVLVLEKGYSYPSGHTMSSVCFYGALILLVLNSFILLPIKIFLILGLLSLIILIGISRIYLGVHYFSDIIAAVNVSLILISIYSYFISLFII